LFEKNLGRGFELAKNLIKKIKHEVRWVWIRHSPFLDRLFKEYDLLRLKKMLKPYRRKELSEGREYLIISGVAPDWLGLFAIMLPFLRWVRLAWEYYYRQSY